MKKITILAFACVALLFSACQKEGVFNPKKKISKIYTSSSYTVDGNTTTSNRMLTEEWTWNKNNTLAKTDHHFGLYESTETYTYDKKRVVRIDGTNTDIYFGNNYTYRIEFKYNGKELAEAAYYDDDELQTKLVFTHQNGKISKIELFGMGMEYMDKQLKSLHSLLPEHLYSSLEKMYKRRLSKSNAKGEATFSWELTWDKNNVSKAICTAKYAGEVEKEIMEYKYDSHNNPFYGYLSPEMAEYSGADYFSKNNIIQITTQYLSSDPDDEGTEIDNYSYTYEGKYPITRTHSETISKDSYTDITEYEYK